MAINRTFQTLFEVLGTSAAKALLVEQAKGIEKVEVVA
jgi:hypothetical protein